MNYDELVRSVARAISNCYDKKSPRIDAIRELCLAKCLGKPILHYDTEFDKSISFAKCS